MWISAFGQFFKFLICIHASITSPCGRCSAMWLRMYSYELIKRPVEQRLCICTNNMSTTNINDNLSGSEHTMWKWSAKERGLRIYISLTDSVEMNKVYLNTWYLLLNCCDFRKVIHHVWFLVSSSAKNGKCDTCSLNLKRLLVECNCKDK